MIKRQQIINSIYPIAFIASIFLVYFMSQYAGNDIVIKALYAPIGLALGMGFYFYTSSRTYAPRIASVNTLQSPKLVYTTVFLTLTTIVITDVTVVGLLIGPAVCYLLLALQLTETLDHRQIIPQLAAILILYPFTLLLTTGFYFGNLDLIAHHRFISLVIETGTTASIDSPQYSKMAGYHILISAVKILSGLSIIDSLILTGTTAFAVFLLISFSTYRMLDLDYELSLFGTIALVGSTPFLFYSTYFFPQSLGTVFIICFLFSIRSATRRYWCLTAIFILGLAATHHFTLFVFAPILGLLYVWFSKRPHVQHLNNAAIAILGLVALTQWIFVTPSFVQGIYFVGSGVLQPSGSQMSTVSSYLFGGSMEPLFKGLLLLLTPEMIYRVILTLLLSLGGISFLKQTKLWDFSPAVIIGICGAVFILRTPIWLGFFNRVGLAFVFFFAILLGQGIKEIFQPRRVTVARVGVLFLLLTSAPIAASNMTILSPDSSKTSFSEQELAELRTAGTYVTTSNITPMTAVSYRVVLENQGGSGKPINVNGSENIMSNEMLLYSEHWSRSRMRLDSGYSGLQTGYFTPQYISQLDDSQNRVYDSGTIRIVGNSHAF